MSWFDGPPPHSQAALERADQAQRWLAQAIAALEGLLATRSDLQVTVVATVQIARGDRVARAHVERIQQELFDAYPGVPLELRIVEAEDETETNETIPTGPPD